jgi:Uma2 family endonuclease
MTTIQAHSTPNVQLPDAEHRAVSEMLPIHRFTIEQYHRMAELEILSDDERVELLEGIVVDMNPILAPHTYSVERTRKYLERMAPAGWLVRPQQPVSLAASEPQPDVAVVRGDDADFVQRHPQPAEIGLLVEVADTTLRRDRGAKCELYAAAGVPEYWIVNLVDRQVEVYADPQPARGKTAARYQVRHIIRPDAAVSFRLGGKVLGRIDAAELIPPATETAP